MVGRKLGFTNESIWRELGLSEPIWAPMYFGARSILMSMSACEKR